MTKTVRFDFDKTSIYIMYSPDEYDRRPIESVFFKKCHRRISNEKWVHVIISLNEYKCNEMVVHRDSIKNISLR
jgi:hypothetical protein